MQGRRAGRVQSRSWHPNITLPGDLLASGDRRSPAVSKGKKGSCSRASRAHQKGFKLGSKGNGDITLIRDGPRRGMPVSGVRSTAQLKCIYANARSMGNKQEELEAIVQQDS